MSEKPIILPPLLQRNSPNQSSRRGVQPTLVVWHETAGNYGGAVNWLCNPQAEASAHLVLREDGNEATQLVHISEKAWHAVSFNPQSIGVEHANTTSKGYSTEHQLQVSARIFGWFCLKYKIPPVWSKDEELSGRLPAYGFRGTRWRTYSVRARQRGLAAVPDHAHRRGQAVGLPPHMDGMNRPTSDWIAIILAGGLSISIVALVIGVIWAAVAHGNTASSLSENETAVLTTAFSGIVGVLGSWTGYRAAERHLNGGQKSDEQPTRPNRWPQAPEEP